MYNCDSTYIHYGTAHNSQGDVLRLHQFLHFPYHGNDSDIKYALHVADCMQLTGVNLVAHGQAV